MPATDLTNPENIIMHNEAHEREKRLQTLRNEMYEEEIQRTKALIRQPAGCFEDVVKHDIIRGLPIIARDYTNAEYNMLKTPLHGIMRPVESKQTKMLYKATPQGIETPHGTETPHGREAYLKERAKMIPEDKYYQPECSSWDYGWHLKDSVRQPKSLYSHTRDEVPEDPTLHRLY